MVGVGYVGHGLARLSESKPTRLETPGPVCMFVNSIGTSAVHEVGYMSPPTFNHQTGHYHSDTVAVCVGFGELALLGIVMYWV